MWYPPSKQQIESNTNPFRTLTIEQLRLKQQQEIAEQKILRIEEEKQASLDEKVKVPSSLIKSFQKDIKNERDYQFAGTTSKEAKASVIADEKELIKVLKFLQAGQIENAYDAFDRLDTALQDVVPQKLLKFMDQNLEESTLALLDEIVRAKDIYPEIDKIKQVLKKKGIGFYTQLGKIMVNPKNEMSAKEALNKAFGGNYEKKTGMQVKGDKKTSLSAETELEEGSAKDKRMMNSVKDKLTKAGIRNAVMFGEVHVAPDNVKEAEKIVGDMPFKVVPQKKLEEMSAKAHWKKYQAKFIVPPIDRERHPNREKEGLEGPYRAKKSGLIFYYDKKEGKYYDPQSDMYLQVKDVLESNELEEATIHTVFVTASRTAYRKLEALIASIDGYKESEFDNGKNMASFVFDANNHGGAARRKVGEFIKKISGATFSHAIAEETELDEAWNADSVKKNADIGSNNGYGINIQKKGSVTKTPYKHMLMLRSTNKKIKVKFDFGKDEFVGSPEQVAQHLNKILGIKESVDLDEKLQFPKVKGKFTPKQIDTLRKEYAKIGSVDPSQPTYKKLTDFLDGLGDDQIAQLAKAKIKFISGLALNRAVKRIKNFSLTDSYEFDSKTGEYVRTDGEDPLGINGSMKREVRESVEVDEAKAEDYKFKKTKKEVERQDDEDDITTQHYDVMLNGKKVGTAEEDDYFGYVDATIHGKRIPTIKGGRGNAERQILIYLKSKRGSKIVAESFEISEAADEVAARELTLYIENDSTLYRQRVQPIIKNLARKMKKGSFDAELAVKGFMYAVEHGLKNYKKDFGDGFKIDKDTKKKVAQDLLDGYMDEIEDAAK